MADNDAEQTALFREVDEELRHEQMDRLWKKYGNLLMTGALVLVLSVAANEGWRGWQASKRRDESNRFSQATTRIEQGKSKEAERILADLASTGGTNYRAMAALRRAAVLAEGGDLAAALVQYRDVAADTSVKPVYRDAALILAVLRDLDHGDPKALESSLQPLTAVTNPWRFSALELSALLARRQGDEARARDMFTRLSDDPETPSGIRSRTTQLLATMPAAPSPAGRGDKKG
ncbi:MAG: tetratricopeptide repeat protein [Alphaproteobacteria bacterium]